MSLSDFLKNESLPYVLQLLRVCVWSVSDPEIDPPTPPFPSPIRNHSTRDLLAFLHKLADAKFVGRVGLLCEDLLNAWVEASGYKENTSSASSVSSHSPTADLTTFDGVVATVRELKALSEQRYRRSARACREKHLLALNMKVNEKGQVSICLLIY